MNKTIAVNISGIIFNIEEEAYNVLHTYLEALKKHLARSAGRDEILADIESRIAELFGEKITDRSQVIILTHVNEVIAVMGQPEDYLLEEEETESPEPEMPRGPYKKRVFRNPDDKLVGGVMGGLAAYFNHDPIWWRLIFVIIIALGLGWPFIIYLILWVIVPEAKTRAEKLQMSGEPVTVETLKKKVEEEAQAIRNNLSNLRRERTGEKLKNTIQEMVQFFINIFGIFFKALGRFLGFFLIAAGIVLFIFVLVSFFGANQSDGFLNFNGTQYSLKELAHMVTAAPADLYLMVYGSLLMLIAILVGCIVGGLKLLKKTIGHPYLNRSGWVTGILFIAGLILAMIGGVKTAKEFASHEEVVQTTALDSLASDTLHISLAADNYFSKLSRPRHSYEEFDLLILDGQQFVSGNVTLDVIKSSGSYIEIEEVRCARGRTAREALTRAESISYNWTKEQNNIHLTPSFTYNYKDKYRSQAVNLTIKLPIGKTVYLGEGTRRMIWDISNVQNVWDPKMEGHYWTMTEKGLECQDCSEEDMKW